MHYRLTKAPLRLSVCVVGLHLLLTFHAFMGLPHRPSARPCSVAHPLISLSKADIHPLLGAQASEHPSKPCLCLASSSTASSFASTPLPTHHTARAQARGQASTPLLPPPSLGPQLRLTPSLQPLRDTYLRPPRYIPLRLPSSCSCRSTSGLSPFLNHSHVDLLPCTAGVAIGTVGLPSPLSICHHPPEVSCWQQ